MIKTVYQGSIERLEILSSDGTVDKKLLPTFTEKQLQELYYWMNLTRVFDTKALNLQRTGRLGTYASTLGQEAANIGSTYALRKQDWLFPSFRMNGGMLLRGARPEQIYQYFGGDERGMQLKNNIFPICITVSEQALHAAGFAWALKLKQQNAAVLTDFGDGATSEGDFHEALNFAGVYKLPVIFLCQNNQYAISVSRKQQTASETLAQKALAYGIQGIQVDGNDIFAVYKATQDAIKNALKGIPTLIEAETYRISDHTTSDDAARYRTSKEVKQWQEKDPILRLRLYLEKKKLWNKKQEEALQKELQEKINTAASNYENIPKPLEDEIGKYTYA